MFTHDHVRSCLFGLFICLICFIWFILETRYRQAWRPELAKTTRQSFGNPDDCSSGRTVIPAAERLFQRPDDCLGGRTITPAYHSGGRILPRIVTPVPPDIQETPMPRTDTYFPGRYPSSNKYFIIGLGGCFQILMIFRGPRRVIKSGGARGALGKMTDRMCGPSKGFVFRCSEIALKGSGFSCTTVRLENLAY